MINRSELEFKLPTCCISLRTLKRSSYWKPAVWESILWQYSSSCLTDPNLYMCDSLQWCCFNPWITLMANVLLSDLSQSPPWPLRPSRASNPHTETFQANEWFTRGECSPVPVETCLLPEVSETCRPLRCVIRQHKHSQCHMDLFGIASWTFSWIVFQQKV